VPDGSITSSFLQMFGRPPRDTGLESERNDTPSAAQRLHLLNSSHILDKISRGRKLAPLLSSTAGGLKKRATSLYLIILSRFPTDKELKALETYAAASDETSGTAALVDLTWALLNSSEFLYRH